MPHNTLNAHEFRALFLSAYTSTDTENHTLEKYFHSDLDKAYSQQGVVFDCINLRDVNCTQDSIQRRLETFKLALQELNFTRSPVMLLIILDEHYGWIPSQ